MKIKERSSLLDRVKLFVVLSVLLFVTSILTSYVNMQENANHSTIETLLQTALEPVGSTMYIWGGGWDDADSEAGATSTQLGLYPQWKIFASQQDETYNYTEHRFERENGLDCSGYVGWVVYNTFETEDGQPGYVTTSTDMAKSFAERGWGKCIKNPKEFLTGDIVSMEGHVWICLGTCEDGSILLVHSSPPGVSVCGTSVPVENEGTSTDEKEQNEAIKESIAVQLATAFMTEHYPKWQEKYPNRMVSNTYLENVTVFRWNTRTMSDAKEYQGMSGEEVLEILRK